jgi:hypothetical protein
MMDDDPTLHLDQNLDAAPQISNSTLNFNFKPSLPCPFDSTFLDLH